MSENAPEPENADIEEGEGNPEHIVVKYGDLDNLTPEALKKVLVGILQNINLLNYTMAFLVNKFDLVEELASGDITPDPSLNDNSPSYNPDNRDTGGYI